MTGVAARYAKALMLAAQAHKGKDVVKNLTEAATALHASIAQTSDVQTFLANPLLEADSKITALTKSLTALKLDKTTTELLTNTIQILAENGRLNVLGQVLQGFVALVDAQEGRITAKVTTASALSSGQKKDIEAWVLSTNKTAKAVMLDEVIDTKLIAGLKIRVGSHEYDASTAGRLSALKQNLNL